MNNNIQAGVCTLVFTLIASGCSESKNNTSDNQSDNRIKVETMTVQAAAVEQINTFTATVEAEVSNNISPQSAMRISDIFVEVGDRVTQGQKLAEMDAVNLKQAQLQLENSELEFRRVDELYKIGGTSRSNWDARKLEYDLASESYNNLLENTILRSPISGIVMKRNYDKGDMYSTDKPLYVVEQIRPVKIVVNVSEALFPQVQKGMKVDVRLDVFGDENFKGTVSLVHPSIDATSRTFPVEIKISNADERIRPGMFARVTFTQGTEQRVLVPDLAVQKQSGSADKYVYTIVEGKAHYQRIETGRRIGDAFEVISGLQPSEVVVTAGHSRLNTGTEVEIIHANSNL